MASYEFRGPRLYVDYPLQRGASVPLDRAQTHYLMDVLRLKGGETVLLFNGRDGEWRAKLGSGSRRAITLEVVEPTRPQTPPGDLHYLFAPLKRARLDYMVQKAVEMGVSHLKPVMTRYTQAERVNTGRMRANAIEAAEQCGILTLPEITEPLALSNAVAALESNRLLVFCDEDAPIADPVSALARFREDARRPHQPFPLAVLIGPEGGFAEDERAMLLARPYSLRLSLGPRILRADTAAVAALALVQAVLGDWCP